MVHTGLHSCVSVLQKAAKAALKTQVWDYTAAYSHHCMNSLNSVGFWQFEMIHVCSPAVCIYNIFPRLDGSKAHVELRVVSMLHSGLNVSRYICFTKFNPKVIKNTMLNSSM